ncbi:hypothetical protein GCM10009430_32820 [Aquimarina litoralis]|uniref:Uncharacterized protein n=1 Tax=Aquimarina litoralis TaxID=584605 RepID=A0ABN1J1S1_9FLAO
MTDDAIGVRLWKTRMLKDNEVRKKKEKVSRVQRMTAERLRTFKGFETYTDQKAKEAIQQLENFAKIIIRYITKREK